MSFRLKLWGMFTATLLVVIWAVAWAASSALTRTFEERDTQRSSVLLEQVRGEIDRQGRDVERKLESIVASAGVSRMATSDTAAAASDFVNEAARMASEQGLDILEIAGPDGKLISSAHWPARFGYAQPWLQALSRWSLQSPFLQPVEFPEGMRMALVAVRTVPAAGGLLYLAGGDRIDNEFLASLRVPEGMQLRIVPGQDEAPPLLRGVVSAVRRDGREHSIAMQDQTFGGIPLKGRDDRLLGVLTVSTRREELAGVRAAIRKTALWTAAAGIGIGLLLSWWASSRISEPVQELDRAMSEVSAGNWYARAAVDSTGEMGRLAAGFNRMTEELKDQRNRMLQAERVAAWRELARRLAHELKNPLFPLQLTVENLARARRVPDIPFDEIFEESTTTLLAEINNLKNIVGRFSDFARMPAPELSRVNVNALAAEVVKLYAGNDAKRSSQVDVRLELQEPAPYCHADPDLLRRALSNLVLNAMDAMPDRGTLTVRTAVRNGKVVIEVADTGAGLTPEECERLFTPYYTTKQHGTGLGLAIVQSVVSDHHGSIQVASEPGKGSTFRIELKQDE